MVKPVQIFNLSVQNKGDSTLDLYVDGVIVDADTQDYIERYIDKPSTISYKSFRNKILEASPTTINLYLAGPGGDVTEALAMYDFMNELEGKGVVINRIGRGLIGSACTYLLVGNNSEMSANSTLFIHEVSLYAGGTITDIENTARTGRLYNDIVTNLYVNHTGQTKEVVAQWMKAETTLSADDAKKYGFVNKVTAKVKFSNTIKPEAWPFQNKAILNLYNADVADAPEPTAWQQFTNEIKNDIMSLKTLFQNAFAKGKETKPADNAPVAEVVNQVMTRVEESFSGIDEEIETSINNRIDEKINERLTTLTNDLKAANDKIAALEAKNTTLTNQVINKTAHASQPAAAVVDPDLDMEGVTFHNRKN